MENDGLLNGLIVTLNKTRAELMLLSVNSAFFYVGQLAILGTADR
jgi:hypothetical protein